MIVVCTNFYDYLQNENIRKWLRNWASDSGNIQLDNNKIDINVVLDELTHEPLVFGQGDFGIHQSFHFGVILDAEHFSV